MTQTGENPTTPIVAKLAKTAFVDTFVDGLIKAEIETKTRKVIITVEEKE